MKYLCKSDDVYRLERSGTTIKWTNWRDTTTTKKSYVDRYSIKVDENWKMLNKKEKKNLWNMVIYTRTAFVCFYLLFLCVCMLTTCVCVYTEVLPLNDIVKPFRHMVFAYVNVLRLGTFTGARYCGVCVCVFFCEKIHLVNNGIIKGLFFFHCRS